MVSQAAFILLLICASALFYLNANRIVKNIRLGRELPGFGNIAQRWNLLFKVALGQSKVSKKPIAGILHIIVYVGFIIVNIELIEILYDGIAGSHRILSFLPFYTVLISFLEVLALLVIIACIIFLVRRNVLKINRFQMPELNNWPRIDANIILCTEIILMLAFLLMNTADGILRMNSLSEGIFQGSFLISNAISPVLKSLSSVSLLIIDKTCWWLHIIGIFAFLNYLPYSKHFHIILAFPNVYYSKLKPLTYITNMESVTREVQIAMGLISDTTAQGIVPETFGAKDIKDLTWKSLMDAYSCTECGRCTSVCPANLTGKKLSPRKIVMDTRDRLEELGFGIRKHGVNFTDDKSLLYNYITTEEIWACTTCNACTYECPVNIDPVSIIIELRRFVFMEKAAAPTSLNAMSVNIENNGAPWQYSAADRYNWTQSLVMNK